jgi:hypothetical protein
VELRAAAWLGRGRWTGQSAPALSLLLKTLVKWGRFSFGDLAPTDVLPTYFFGLSDTLRRHSHLGIYSKILEVGSGEAVEINLKSSWSRTS